MAKDYSRLVPIPAAQAMNGGLSYPTAGFMLDLFGAPRKKLTDDCMSVTNQKLKAKFVEGFDVGPFNVTGLKPFAEALARIFAKVGKEKPDLLAQVSTAGSLCCRRIRNSESTPSNHSFGAAIDLKINGKLDDRGNGKCQEGLLLLYPYFHNEGFWWGAEYRGPFEDSMHWEIARETLKRWRAAGRI